MHGHRNLKLKKNYTFCSLRRYILRQLFKNLVNEYRDKVKQQNGAVKDVLLVKEREHVLAELGLTRNEAERNFHANTVIFHTTLLMYDLHAIAI